MSDYEYDDGYDNDEYKNEYEENLNDIYEINDEMENIFKAAKNANNISEAIDNYNMLIEMEISNSQSRNFSFQSYEALCLIYIELKDIEKFKNSFSQIQLLISSSIENFDEKFILPSIENILEKLNKIKINEYKYKEIFVNVLYEMIQKKKTEKFYRSIHNYIYDNEEFSVLREENKIKLNIIFPKIRVLNVKKIITQDKLIKSLVIKDYNKCIIIPLSIDKFIYYLESEYNKAIVVSNKNYLTNEIIINNSYNCFCMKKLFNNDIVLCLEKESKIIRCNLQDNTYAVIQTFEIQDFPCYTYCEELSKDKIALGKSSGFSIWNKINENNYQCMLIYNIKKRKIFPIDNKTFLLYSFHEKIMNCSIELRFYELESLNFYGKVFLNLGNILYKGSLYKLNQRQLNFLKLDYLQKYILIIGCQDSIWIINLKTFKILYTVELQPLKDLIVLKDGSFIVLYEPKIITQERIKDQPDDSVYESYYFNGEQILKRWEGITKAQSFSIFDDLEILFVIYFYMESKMEVQEMKFELYKEEYNGNIFI